MMSSIAPGGSPVQPDWVGIQTWVVVKEDGRRFAVAYQNSRVAPGVQEELGVVAAPVEMSARPAAAAPAHGLAGRPRLRCDRRTACILSDQGGSTCQS